MIVFDCDGLETHFNEKSTIPSYQIKFSVVFIDLF